MPTFAQSILRQVMMQQPLKTFIIYARADARFKDELLVHLQGFVRKNLIQKWVDSDLLPGEEWEKRIEAELDAAHLVLMLVSGNALNSDFIQKKELRTALEKKRLGNARVVPILVRDCLWELEEELAELQMLPKDEGGKIWAVEAWTSPASAWASTCRELHKLIQEVHEKQAVEIAQKQQQEAELAQKQAAEAEKNEKRRSKQDNIFWEKIRLEAEKADNPAEKITLFNRYLADPEHQNHRAEAEDFIEDLEAEIAAAEKLGAETRRIAELKAETKRNWRPGLGRKSGFEMVKVEGGTFTMGSNEHDSEKPPHQVKIQTFSIGKYPITQADWREIMGSDPPEIGFKGCDQCPVESVSWFDVQDFLEKLNQKFSGKNYRLPSEAEWEFAARGGNQSMGFEFSGSNNLNSVAWNSENSNASTSPVGEKNANELGIYDMSGNVWEWCQDQWHFDYHGAPSDGSAWGTGKSGFAVLRGGSFYNYEESCRSSFHNMGESNGQSSLVGFRIAKDEEA